MGWRTTDDVAEFIAVAGEYLRRERARNTVILTVSEQLRVNPASERCRGNWPGEPAAAGLVGRSGRRDRRVPAPAAPSRSCSPPSRPTSNSIYQRIGYRAVEDRVVLAFSIR
jgi:hypothetical protein